ncbi:MAG: iron ABC transporter permease [Coriobacteriales bacterium]|jgi:iron complex transport system permease protein|nr:iron ABC transporter permease [Coriobacteriales bacterium]
MAAASTARRRAPAIVVAFVVLAVLLGALAFVSMNLGSLKVSLPQLFEGLFVAYDETVATVYDLRFPRIIIAILAGAALAVAGTLLQAVIKNPVADPGIIGISSGAAFGALVLIAAAPMLYFFAPLAAFAGGMAAFAIVYGLAWDGGLDPLRIILIGVAVSATFAGLTTSFDAMGGGLLGGVTSVVNGNITMKTWDDVFTLLWYVATGLVAALLVSVRCNLLALEDSKVRSLGINIDRLRLVVSLIAVLLASIATAIVGVVGFLGLIAPHIARLIVGSDHRVLVPFSILLGAFILLFADTLGRTVAAPYEISAGVVMAVIGGPFFIVLLRRSMNTRRAKGGLRR